MAVEVLSGSPTARKRFPADKKETDFHHEAAAKADTTRKAFRPDVVFDYRGAT